MSVVVVDLEQLREELRNVIAAEVKRAVSEALAANASRPVSEWMTPEQVAAELGYERRTIPALVKRRGLPCHPIGRKFRFRRSEVDAWVRSGGRADAAKVRAERA